MGAGETGSPVRRLFVDDIQPRLMLAKAGTREMCEKGEAEDLGLFWLQTQRSQRN